MFFDLLSTVVLRKVGSSDDAEACEDSKCCPEKCFHSKSIIKKEKSLQLNQLKTLFCSDSFTYILTILLQLMFLC